MTKEPKLPKEVEERFEKEFPTKGIEDFEYLIKFKQFLAQEIETAKEKLSKEMANAILQAKGGWIDEGRIEERKKILKKIEVCRRFGFHNQFVLLEDIKKII